MAGAVGRKVSPVLLGYPDEKITDKIFISSGFHDKQNWRLSGKNVFCCKLLLSFTVEIWGKIPGSRAFKESNNSIIYNVFFRKDIQTFSFSKFSSSCSIVVVLNLIVMWAPQVSICVNG